MAPEKYHRECKQCFRVVLEQHYRRHLSSHDHQVKACVLAMGRKILSSCPQCKNTKIAQIRAQCIKCCRTLEKMYDAILKPLEPLNAMRGASTSTPQKLNVTKLDNTFLSRALNHPKSKTSSGTPGTRLKIPKPQELEASSDIIGSCSKALQAPESKSSSGILDPCSKTLKKISTQLSTKSIGSSGISESCSKAFKPPTLKTASGISRPCLKVKKTPTHLSFKRASPSHGSDTHSKTNTNQLCEKPRKTSKVSKTLFKSFKTPHANQQCSAKPSNEQSKKRPHDLASKASEKSKKPLFLKPHSLQPPNNNPYNTSIYKYSESTNFPSNAGNSSLDHQAITPLPVRSCKKEAITASEECSSEKPYYSGGHYNPLSLDKAIEIKLETPQPSTSTAITTHPSDQLATSKSTIISVKVVESSPGVSEYIFKFTKSSPSDDTQLKLSSPAVQLDTRNNQPVTRVGQEQSNVTFNSFNDTKTHQCEKELGNLFPQLNSKERARPLAPLTEEDLVTTLLGVERLGDEVTFYEDWFLAAELESDFHGSTKHRSGTPKRLDPHGQTEHKTVGQKIPDFHDQTKPKTSAQDKSDYHDQMKQETVVQNKKVNGSQIKCRDLSSLIYSEPSEKISHL